MVVPINHSKSAKGGPAKCETESNARRELATELARDVLPQLQGSGTKLLLFSIGTPERGKEFADKTGFPEDLLLADPKGETYAAVRHVICGDCSCSVAVTRHALPSQPPALTASLNAGNAHTDGLDQQLLEDFLQSQGTQPHAPGRWFVILTVRTFTVQI